MRERGINGTVRDTNEGFVAMQHKNGTTPLCHVNACGKECLLCIIFVRIQWYSGPHLDAITTEAIRVRTGAVGYTSFNIFH